MRSKSPLFATAVVVALLALPVAVAEASINVRIVNRSGQPDNQVFVMLHGGGSSDGQLSPDSAKTLSSLPGKQFSINSFSGRIFFSYGKPVRFNEANRSRTRYDKVELTYPGVANLTAVDFFGIPFTLQAKSASGKSLGKLSFNASTDTIRKALLKIKGARKAQVKTASGGFARILSPQLSPMSYPSLSRYIRSLSGTNVTLRGNFFGAPPTGYAYSGPFGSDDTISLNGTLAPRGGPTAPGEQLTVAGSTLPSAVYTVDGPYTWGGATHHVGDNDVYAVLYRDLISGFAWGYWGGKYGNDSRAWQGKPPFAAARKTKTRYSTYNEYAAVIYKYSNAYGFSFSDTGPKKVQLKLDGAATLVVTILPDRKK